MAGTARILIAGGAGVFGRLLARELLATTPADLVLAGRDIRRLVTACHSLGNPQRVEPVPLDLSNPAQLRRAAKGCFAVACAAGPFQALPRELPQSAVQAGAHWLDIADDAGWILAALSDSDLDAYAQSSGLAVVPGLSTTPALTGALARWCQARVSGARTARLTLFIGNRNPKGSAAIGSAMAGGVSTPFSVDLPVGRRSAYRFASADATLLAQELGLEAEFRVAFEWRLAALLLALLAPAGARLAPAWKHRLARLLAIAAGPFNRFGTDAGCLQAEVWPAQGPGLRAALTGLGQRMAILPCVFALESLLSGTLQARGLIHPETWLTSEQWVERLEARGMRFASATVANAA
jgi:hypothetical protein